MVYLPWAAHVIPSPNNSRGPVATIERLVVLHRSRCAPNVDVGFLVLRTAQKPMAHLEGPIGIWHDPKPCRAGVPFVRIEVVTILMRLPFVKYLAFKLQAAITEC